MAVRSSAAQNDRRPVLEILLETREKRMTTKLFILVSLAGLTVFMAGCTATMPTAPESATPADTDATATEAVVTPAMDHSMHMNHSDSPFDAQFIDGMIVHHQGAIEMANEVLAQSERPELRAMAEAIIAAQTQEIDQMRAWRADWYPDLPPTPGMEMDMGDMRISTDESVPFDQRFLTAMISHHEGAVDMAQAVLEQSEREELRMLAEAIIAAQTQEIDQMRRWLAEWFGN
jgi:uncharacterized protein (DUF305 family)